MKSNNNLSWKFWMLLLAFPTVFFISCEEKIEDALPPVIEMIRSNIPEESNAPLEKGGLGQTIVIVGKNLQFTQEIYINDFKTSFLPTFATSTHLVVTIDDETPNFATHGDVSNKIRIVNDAGSAEKDLIILPPAPRVASISNEFAKAGETLQITGQYFFFVEGVEFPGGVISTQVTAGPNGRTLGVVVPEGVSEAGFVRVITESGAGSSAPAWRFNDSTGMFADMDEMNPFGAWGALPVLGSSDPDPVDGNYIRVTGTDIPSPMWWNNDQVVPLNHFNADDNPTGFTWPVLVGDPADYAIKFELNTAAMWNSGWFEVNLGWTFFYRFMPWNTPPSPAQYWSVGTRTDVNTNGWQTMVIPLNMFRLKPGNDPDGEPIGSLADLAGKGLVMAFQNPDAPGGVPIPNFHLCFDNFRLVKIK